MGRIWMPGGGGGVDLDVVTAASGDILKGKVIVGADGEPLTGVLELTGNAADSQVLSGKTYYNTDAKGKRTGTMPNKGAVITSLNCGGSYTIPVGYHNGSGKVTANSLLSQTDATATAGDILSGKTAWVKGSKVTGTMTNQGAKTSSLNCGGSYTIPAGYHNGSGKVTANSLSSQTDATAAAGDILTGKTAWVKGTKLSGSMANQGAKTASLNCGGSYTIPAGYHNGSGKVTANSLASQTGVQSGKTAAGAGQILTGYEAWVNGGRVTGSMKNHVGTPDHITARRTKDSQYQVAVTAGYHGYSWDRKAYEYVTYAELASDIGLTAEKVAKGRTVIGVAGTYTSDANAAAGDILTGKTAYVNGCKVTGTVTVQSILSFSAAPYGIKWVLFNWKNPSKGAFSGVIIVYKTGSYPTNINDGTRIYKGSGTNTSANGTSSVYCQMPSETTTYYFRAFSYAIKNNAEWIHATTYTATVTTGKSVYPFTSSGTFTVPQHIYSVDIFCLGGGGGGGSSRNSDSDSAWDRQASGGGGAGGHTWTKLNCSVSPGTTMAITVGAGGTGGAANASSQSAAAGKAGGTSKVTYNGKELVSAFGGGGGQGGYNSTGGAGGHGGSGGGGGNAEGGESGLKGTTGGSDGSDGSHGANAAGGAIVAVVGGTGQGTTTRAFGESSGTLYAGGGSGGQNGWSAWDAKYSGYGGAGGGGNSPVNTKPTAGGTNTGGGGGGAGMSQNSLDVAPSFPGGNGGSGIVLIRVHLDIKV